MNKKGLSNLVATVLIILLVLAAIILIWAYIKITVEVGSEQYQLKQECITKNLEIINCNYNDQSINGQIISYSLVRQKQGDPTDYIVALDLDDGTTVTRYITQAEILQTRKINFATSQIPIKMSITPIIRNTANTMNVTCPLTTEVSCVRQRCRTSGDLCDFGTTCQDIELFINATQSLPPYNTPNPSCSVLNADYDCSGATNFLDIDPFLHTLTFWPNCNRNETCSNNCYNVFGILQPNSWCDAHCIS